MNELYGCWRKIAGATPGRRLALVTGWAGVSALLARAVVRQEAGGLIFRPTIGEVLAVLFLLCVTIVVVIVTGFYRRWIFWRPAELGERRLMSVAAACVAVILLTEAFAACSSLLVQSGTIRMAGFRPPQTEKHDNFSVTFGYLNGTFGHTTDVYEATEQLLAWHVLDSIPALKVPETLNWRSPKARFTDARGGGLLLCFKCLAILPLVSLVVRLLKPPESAK